MPPWGLWGRLWARRPARLVAPRLKPADWSTMLSRMQAASLLTRSLRRRALIIKPDWTNELARDVREGLTDWGWHPELTGKPMAVIDTLDELLTQNVTLKGMDTLRRVAQQHWGQTHRPV